MHGVDSLYLVFDLVDTDLKQCMDSQIQGLSMPTIRVRAPAPRRASPPAPRHPHARHAATPAVRARGART